MGAEKIKPAFPVTLFLYGVTAKQRITARQLKSLEMQEKSAKPVVKASQLSMKTSSVLLVDADCT